MPPKKSTAAKKKVPKSATPKKAPTKKSAPAKKVAAKKAPATQVKKKTAPKSAPSKKAPAKAAGAKKAVAKSSIAPTKSAGSTVSYGRWMWMNDSGTWSPFDIRQNDVMEQAYTQSMKQHTKIANLKYNNWDYDIDFATMTQKNKSTGRVRKLQRDVLASTSSGKTKESAVGKRQRTLQKGRGVVDSLSGKADSCHVYEGVDGTVFQCTLNQTNVSTNNNKFYIIQLLEADDVNQQFFLFTRWGRVGVDGYTMTEPFTNVLPAIAAFKRKFRDKTSNDWDSRATFTKVPGKYFFMQMDYTASDDAATASPTPKKARQESSVAASKLPKAVQELMQLIGSKEALNTTLKELEIDTAKMPLGKISKTQIQTAYTYLKTIEAELKKKNPKVEEATGLFYTLIPHDFGFRRPPLIDSVARLKEKMELLETLSQLEIATKLLDEGTKKAKELEHPLDRSYHSLKCDVVPVAESDADFKRIVEYAANTQGKTHTAFKIRVERVFRIRRSAEEAKYQAHSKSIANKQMLWHGSRSTNFMGILSQGLRIAPPEAPVTGYMFGKGIYLADVCSKSANYCNTTRTHNTGLMLLCEAALGTTKDFTGASYMEKSPKGHHSTKGVGRMYPDPRGCFTGADGVMWPKGKMMDDAKLKTSLLYPEYIVYDTAQVAMRYLVQMKFEYK